MPPPGPPPGPPQSHVQKHNDQKHNVQKHNVQKHNSQKHNGQKHNSQKHNDQKHHSQKHNDQKHHSQKHHDQLQHKGGDDSRPRRQQTKILVPVPDEFVGFVLGSKGNSIRKVKDDTRADYIRLHPAEPEEARPDPYFVVKGSPIAVECAKGTILEMAMEAYRRSKKSGMTENERNMKAEIDELTNDIARLQTMATTNSFTPSSPTYISISSTTLPAPLVPATASNA